MGGWCVIWLMGGWCVNWRVECSPTWRQWDTFILPLSYNCYFCLLQWSYGICLWEFLTRGQVPYPDITNGEVKDYLKRGERMSQPDYCPAAMLVFSYLKVVNTMGISQFVIIHTQWIPDLGLHGVLLINLYGVSAEPAVDQTVVLLQWRVFFQQTSAFMPYWCLKLCCSVLYI